MRSLRARRQPDRDGLALRDYPRLQLQSIASPAAPQWYRTPIAGNYSFSSETVKRGTAEKYHRIEGAVG